MAESLIVVEKQISELAPLDCHRHIAVKDRLRRENLAGPAAHLNRPALARARAHAASEAELLVADGATVAGISLRGGRAARFDRDRSHGARLLAGPAAAASIGVDLGEPTARGNRRADLEPPDAVHHRAAAAAAVADEGHPAADILGSLHQAGFLRPLKNSQPLEPIDFPCRSVADQGFRRAAKCQADVLGCIAGVAKMLRLVATRAARHGHPFGRPDDPRCPFPVEHLGVVPGQRFFMDQRPADLRFPLIDAVGQPVVAPHVFVEQPGQFGHRQFVAGAHEREFKTPESAAAARRTARHRPGSPSSDRGGPCRSAARRAPRQESPSSSPAASMV